MKTADNALARHVLITGDVQGVGYRFWVMQQATERGLAGWVRNQDDGRVEALFYGPGSEVEAMIAACRKGPRAARVESVRVEEAAAPQQEGFDVFWGW